MRVVKTAAIVLAAGASTRLGETKQLIRLGGETLLERAVRVAREAGCAPVVIVLGANAAAIVARCVFGDAMVTVNADWSEGMSASIGCGIATVAGEVEGAIVMACDQPAVTAEHLRALRASGGTMASAYAGRHGVPAFFPAAVFDDLLELRGDAGARTMLQMASAVPLPHGELDIDTREELERARGLFGGEAQQKLL